MKLFGVGIGKTPERKSAEEAPLKMTPIQRRRGWIEVGDELPSDRAVVFTRCDEVSPPLFTSLTVRAGAWFMWSLPFRPKVQPTHWTWGPASGEYVSRSAYGDLMASHADLLTALKEIQHPEEFTRIAIEIGQKFHSQPEQKLAASEVIQPCKP